MTIAEIKYMPSVCRAFLRQGSRGGFAALIGDAFGAADSTNRARLLAAFPDLFQLEA